MISTTIWQQLEAAESGSRHSLQNVLNELAWNGDGLIPAIAQRHDTGEVLMMAWVNAESLAETLATGQVCYWSRSRQCLWRKGESSGHTQRLIEARLDCDGDCLLLLVEQTGPACHTLRSNCFYNAIRDDAVEVLCNPGHPA